MFGWKRLKHIQNLVRGWRLITVAGLCGALSLQAACSFGGGGGTGAAGGGGGGGGGGGSAASGSSVVNNAPVAVDGTLSLASSTTGTLVATDADGNSLTYSIVSAPAKGSVTITNAATGAFTFSPLAGSGVTSFTFKANDGSLDSNTSTVIVAFNGNQAPVSTGESQTFNEDNSFSGTVDATDAESDSLVYSIVTGPTKGSVTLNAATGAYTYTPNADANGSDSFTFKASDRVLSSNTSTVSLTITAVNDDPTLTAISAQTTDEDTTITGIAFTADEGGGADENAQSVTVSATSSNTTIVANTGIAVTCNDAGNGCAGTISITPVANAFGTTTITVTASDGALTTQRTFDLTVVSVNDVPVANNLAVSTAKNVAVSVKLFASDPVEGSPLTYSIVANPQNGTLTGAAPDLTYTPNNNYAGSDTFTYQAHDGISYSNVATVRVLVAGSVAFIVADPTALAAADVTVSNRLTALGFTKTIVADNNCQTTDANGKDLVIISSTVNSTLVAAKFTSVAVPVMTWERNLYDDLKFTAAGANGTSNNQTQITIVDSTHPLSAGLSGNVGVFTGGGAIVWGTLASGAKVIATVRNDATKPVLFEYPAGATMAGGFVAPARRVGYFLPNDSAATLTANGVTLLDAAINSALTP